MEPPPSIPKSYMDCKEFFVKHTIEKDKLICKLCSKSLIVRASSTTGLHRHLEHIHQMKRAEKNEPDAKKIRMQESNSIVSYCKKLTLEEVVAELAAYDNIPINKIANSRFIRRSLNQQGYNLPKNPREITNLIYKQYDHVKSKIIAKIVNMKKENHKFSLVIDEWTTFKHRKFLNVHVYFQNDDSENLGMVRIHGKGSAEKLVSLVDSKIKSFGLEWSDIVATTSDGASVMILYGTLSPANLIICYNHGIHLAVSKMFYCKKSTTNIETIENDIINDNDEDCVISDAETSDNLDSESDDNDSMYEIVSIKLKFFLYIFYFFIITGS